MDGDTKVYEGMTAIGFVFDEIDEDTGRSMAFIVGKGDKRIELTKAAMLLGNLVRDELGDKLEAAICGGIMAKALIDAAFGESDFIKSAVTKAVFDDET